MWPWAHLAVGYLVYAAIVRYRGRRVPGDVPALAVALGTQAPDLVDKPLAWYLPVLPGGRSLAHSVFAMAVVVGATVTVLRYRGRATAAVAFAVGYLTHPIADAVDPVLAAEYADLAFLLWPVVALPQHEGPSGLFAVIQRTEFTVLFALQIAITVVGVAVWLYQGRPGVAPVRAWIRRFVGVGRPSERRNRE